MNIVVHPSARETFTPREITTAYKHFEERGPQYVDTETGLRAATYQFGTRLLLVYEESETGLMVLMNPSACKENSAKSNFRCTAFSEVQQDSEPERSEGEDTW